jgi:hypothetical protein
MKLGELLSHEDPIIVNLMKSLTIEASNESPNMAVYQNFNGCLQY